MTASNQLQKIKEECRDWIVELSDDEASAEERAQFQAEFKEWIMADPVHAECFEESQRLWGAIGQMHHLADVITVQNIPARISFTDRVKQWLNGGRGHGWKTATSVSMAFITLAVFIGVTFNDPKVFSTNLAELRNITLPDDSLITLGAKSTIEVDFTAEKRQVFLKDGEAFFVVTKDPARPFFVAVDGVNLRVVGTKFDVHRGPYQVRISVLEGVVEVTTPNVSHKASFGGNKQTSTLTSGQQIIAGKQDKTIEIKQINLDQLGSWRSGRLTYDGAKLRDVVADINRYYGKKIILGSADIATLKVTASFRTNRVDQMMNTLLDALPVTADYSKKGQVILRPAS